MTPSTPTPRPFTPPPFPAGAMLAAGGLIAAGGVLLGLLTSPGTEAPWGMLLHPLAGLGHGLFAAGFAGLVFEARRPGDSVGSDGRKREQEDGEKEPAKNGRDPHFDWNLFTSGTFLLCVLLAIIMLVLLIKTASAQAGAQAGAQEAARRAADAADQTAALTKRVDELASRPAAAPGSRAPAPVLPPDLTEKIEGMQAAFKKLQDAAAKLDENLALTGAVNKVAAAVQELISKRDALPGNGTSKSGGQLDDVSMNKIAATVHLRLVPLLADLKKDSPRADPPAERRAVRDALREVLAAKEIQDQLADAVLTRWKKDGSNSKDIETILKKRLDELEKLIEKAANSAAAPTEAEDVIVLTTHSRALPANEHVDVYKRLFNDLPRDPGGKYRLGFSVATTSNLEVKLSLKDGPIKSDTFNIYKPTGDETEKPDKVGSQLFDQFDDKRPNQRCVLVVSARCDAPRPDMPGWQDVRAVDVVLLRSPGQTGGAALGPWLDFCQAKKGTLTVLTPDKERLEEQFLQTLLRLAAPRRK